MTIMAGLSSRMSGEKPPPSLCRELRGLTSRHPADKAIEFVDDRLWMAKIDIDAFGSPGIYTDEAGACSQLTGEHSMRLVFANPIAARRAIADEVRVPLAKLSDEDRTFIDALLARTLARPEIITAARERFPQGRRRGIG
jgi:hypothetical protein